MFKSNDVARHFYSKTRFDPQTELEAFDPVDWELFCLNDSKIRSQRRFFECESGQGLHNNKCTGISSASHNDLPAYHPDTEQFDDEIVEFIQIDSWDGREWQEDKAQNEFEAQLKSSEKGDQPNLESEQEHASFENVLDQDFLAPQSIYEVDSVHFDWAEFAFEADEFQDVPDRGLPLQTVRTTGKVSRHNRARQQAIEVGEEFNWDEAGIQLLAGVFEKYGWNAAKRAVRNQLEHGLTPDELEIAVQIRELWSERTEFSINFGWSSYFANAVCGVSKDHYHALTWGVSIQLIRLTDLLPDIAEIEHLLDELYTTWYNCRYLHDSFPSFYCYLCDWLDYVTENPEIATGNWETTIEFASVSDLDEDDDKMLYRFFTLRQLIEYGL